ncbi:MAG: OsmC family protein [Kiloniellaceae bacterium]
MAKEHGYEVKLTWTGAAQGPVADYAGYSREYRIEVAGKPPLAGSADPMFKGDAALHNPEDLLVAALSGCHMLTYLALCARAGIEVVSYEDTAGGTMVLEGGGGHFTEATLRPRVVVAAGSDVDKARALHANAHADCFIANSVNFPVRNEPEVIAAAAAPAPA